MWDWTVTLEDGVPYLDRVEIDAPGARDFDFPVADVRIEIDGVAVPKTQVEVSVKLVGDGGLTVVNKTRNPWDEGSELHAYVPVAP